LPYRRILERLLARVAGGRAALLLDSQGELVVGAGDLGEKERLIGAYSGITLGMAQRSATRCRAGAIDHLVWRHDNGSVVICPLKDGYYVALFLGPEALVAAGIRCALETRPPLDEEI
jgi:predicted regulator of Ras-like GTPase activity (Roadblock/LC7/MglB family)